MTPGIPSDLITTVETHGKAVAAADNRTVLRDFMPDRLGQLIASADVAAVLKGSEVRNIAAVGDRLYYAIIRYTKPDDNWFELRSPLDSVHRWHVARRQRAQHPRHAAVVKPCLPIRRRSGYPPLGWSTGRQS